MTSTFTPNLNLQLQGTNDNPGTWGSILNSNVFTLIDTALGGTYQANVAGNSNITLTTAQAGNLIHDLTGVLTGNIQYIFPASAGRFVVINNATTGSFTVTVTPSGGTGVVVTQGTQQFIYIDSSNATAYIPVSASNIGALSKANNLTDVASSAFALNNIGGISGSFVNKFRNGTFDIAQRGTAGTITAGSPAYSLDGWIISATGANVTWAQTGSHQNGTYNFLDITGATSNTDVLIKQRIESYIAQQLLVNSSNVTVQFAVYNNTSGPLVPTLTVKHANAQDNFSSMTTDVNAVSLQSCPASGAITTVAYTFTPNSSSYLGLEVTIDFGAIGNGLSVGLIAADIRVSPGDSVGQNSTPSTFELRPYSVELAFCQRYLPAYNGEGSNAGHVGSGYAVTSTQTFTNFVFPVPTRAIPTGVTVSSASHFQINSTTSPTPSAITFSQASITAATVSSAITGLTAGFGCHMNSVNGSASLLFTGAEL